LARARAQIVPPLYPPLGVIEGFFGRPWSWQARRHIVATLAPRGFSFYHYAPKADAFLRRRWREPHPDAQASEIAAFARFCREHGVRFGLGLSPFEAFHDDGEDTRAALMAKVGWLNDLGIDDLAILFDDMRGDVPELAVRQARLVDLAGATTRASKLLMCPSYYSDDPVLDRVFGARPPAYLADLGRLLDPAVGIYWTGEEVCSRAISTGHLAPLVEALRRKPTLWDNYPVNDGPRMSQFLHLRGVTGRSPAIRDLIDGHGANPALQPHLSLGPLATLAMSYAQGDAYCYAAAGHGAHVAIHGEEVAEALRGDLLTLNDAGLSRIGEETRARLVARYAAIDHPAAREVLGWLAGEDLVSADDVQTQ
jgi:hyaluronoglucosaminidase